MRLNNLTRLENAKEMKIKEIIRVRATKETVIMR